jgi:hypothetical protein
MLTATSHLRFTGEKLFRDLILNRVNVSRRPEASAEFNASWLLSGNPDPEWKRRVGHTATMQRSSSRTAYLT